MKTIGYCRVSSSAQDLESQRMLILEYAHRQKIIISEFIEVEKSSRLSRSERKIDELKDKLSSNDLLIVAELSRLGRNFLETLNIINELTEMGVNMVFLRQPELSTFNSAHGKLLVAIYSYFADLEREYIKTRTIAGLAAAKAKGKLLGRPKGAKNSRMSPFEFHKDEIKKLLKQGIPKKSILKIINSDREVKLGYTSLRYFIEHDTDLRGVSKT